MAYSASNMAPSAPVQVGLIQASTPFDPAWPIEKIKSVSIEKHLPLIEEAGKRGVQILGLQEIFAGPYFCPSQDTRWYEAAEPVPGPTIERMQTIAKRHKMAMVVPVYEREQAGVYAQHRRGSSTPTADYLGKYRKSHIPQVGGFLGEVLLQARQPRLARPSRRATRRSGSTSVTTGISRRGRAFSASTARRLSSIPRPRWPGCRSISGSSSSRPMPSRTATSWPPATAHGTLEAPWNIGKFYGSSYVVDPRGNSSRWPARTATRLIIAACDPRCHRRSA